MEVAMRMEKGPTFPPRISFKGRMNKLIKKIPRGGIQTLLRMDEICIDPWHTYCTHALHKPVNRMEIPGRRIQPRREKDQSIKDGTEIMSPKVIKVRITAWTTPKVCCMA
jgi:hypothetical protein